jgi:hypothetical protein
LSVTLTGARILPNVDFGSKVSGMKQIEPSRTIVVLNVLVTRPPRESFAPHM